MNFLKLFHSIKIVSGKKRSLIYDTQSDFVAFIPNDLFQVLKTKSGFDVREFNESKSNHNFLVIKEYVDFLIRNKLAFYCQDEDEFKRFSFTEKTYKVDDSPFELDYLIIDISRQNTILNKDLISQIIYYRVLYLQLRFCEEISVEEFKEIMRLCTLINESFVEEISFVLKYNENLYQHILSDKILINKYLNFKFYSHKGSLEDYSFENFTFTFINSDLSFPFSCGVIKKDNFVYNEKFYTESKYKNTCLNRKISIDSSGNIKNCPSMNYSYGNIKETTFGEVLKDIEFKRKWNISKRQINVCKDCEFRTICMDCRAYLEDPDDELSKPLKCGYNPYDCTWENWSENPLKQRTFDEYLIKKE